MSTNIETIAVKRNDGSDASLADYAGKVRLVVNVASKCGLTPQYEGLQRLYEEKRAAGLEVLAFPANNFKGQEPGTDAQIRDFCTTQYHVTFPLFAKISALGDDRHPLYTALVQAKPEAIGEGPFRERLKGFGIERENPADILWNFEKFLIGRNGQVVARFSPDVKADDPRLLAAIDAELAKSGRCQQ
ncbi:glutathione peroxidase [Pandoraea nosoerga]|nr:glutathione peroxidase [Pandoraea nosoerga]MBN4666884.1 glutathione peroxidase [Pandoraea nosoerga]MBN4677016.1 glutathione peroxidase [Pandoraea nosoerga]MBN4681685.1 glutathione peroxidase [Pandoraea nosoerga]MBN4744911.1 glutathione peroxidase [Pandoraea nosoerga]